MLFKKRILIFFILGLIFQTISVPVTADVTLAGLANPSIVTVTATDSAAPESSIIDGKQVWKIANAENSKVLFDVDESFEDSSVDGSTFIVDIEYYDKKCDILNNERNLSFFHVWVNAIDYGLQRVCDVTLVGDGVWKKATIEVDNACFANTINGNCDIMISMYDQRRVSYVPLYLKSVNILRGEKKNSVLVKSEIEETGNTFAYYEEKHVKNTFTNTKNEELSLKVKYCLTDKNGDVKFSYDDYFILPSRSKTTRDVIIDSALCGLFEWVVEISDDTGIINERLNASTIAIVKTAEDGLKCESAWLNCHLNHYPESMWNVCTELINHANVKGVRLGVPWYNVEKGYGLNLEVEKIWRMSDFYDRYGIDYWVLLSGCSQYYQDPYESVLKIPTTQTEVNGWENYCKYVIEKYAERGVDLFEVWNEPNVSSFNPTNATPQHLAEITKRAKKAANELLQEDKLTKPVKIAGMGLASMNYNSNYENWLKPAVDAGIANDGTGMDVLNVHTYVASTTPELTKIYNSVQKYRDYIYSKTGRKDIPVLVSEYGNSSAQEFVSDKVKSDWNTRSLILYKMYGIGDQVAIYNLEKKGVLSNSVEDNFGLISPVYENLNIKGKCGIPTESYISYAAMNYMLRGEVTPIEMLDCGENIKINRLARNTLNDEVIALWTAYDAADIKLNLGTNSVKYYDSLGNECIMNSDDGIYNFSLDGSVAYITGNFNNCELVDAKQCFYEGFKNHTYYIPHNWSRITMNGSPTTNGATIWPVEIDDAHGTSLLIGSKKKVENGQSVVGNHALFREVGYVVKEHKPVIFHTEFMVKKEKQGSYSQNTYQICVTRTNNSQDVIFGFKLKDKIGYWDENRNSFVWTEKSFEAGKWLNFDAIYYPESEKVDYYVNNVKIGSGKVDLDNSNVLGKVLIASHTMSDVIDESKFQGIYDNLCLMTYDGSIPLHFSDKEHSIESGTIQYDFTAINLFNKSKNVKVLSAYYNADRQLVKINIETVTIEKMTLKGLTVEASDNYSGCFQVKFFIWDDEKLIPLTDVYAVRAEGLR